MKTFSSLCLLWSLHLSLSDLPYIIKFHFKLAETTQYQAKILWMGLTLAITIFWENSSMSVESIWVLTLGSRLWAELMIGCKHRFMIIVAQSILGSTLLYGISSITYWGDFAPLILGCIALLQSFKVLNSNPKDYQQPQCQQKRRYKLY